MAKSPLFNNWTWKLGIEAVIAELDYHQSAMKGNGSVTLPQSAYV